MNREIKFRCWDSDLKIWINNLGMSRNNVLTNGNEKVLKVMQYTGLNDKNGKEIYEGDIVKTGTDKPMVITWNKRFASFCIERDGWAFSHWFGESMESNQCEVIGNIYENPELLLTTKKVFNE